MDIQLCLPGWKDFEDWVKSEYKLAMCELQPASYSAYTTPSAGPLKTFDLNGLVLTEKTWDRALSVASHQGLLMVILETEPITVPHLSEPKSETAPQVEGGDGDTTTDHDSNYKIDDDNHVSNELQPDDIDDSDYKASWPGSHDDDDGDDDVVDSFEQVLSSSGDSDDDESESPDEDLANEQDARDTKGIVHPAKPFTAISR